MNQKQGVYEAVCGEIGYERSEQDDALTLTPDQKAAIRQTLCDNFRADEIELTDEAKTKMNSDPKWLGKYVSGLLNNWVRKDKRFNGGVQYVAKNPGSRAGSGDAVLREMKKLEKIHVAKNDEETLVEIRRHIAERKTEIEADKTKSITVDMSKIPAGLRDIVS